MSRGEPRTAWNWVIVGCGGVIQIMESLQNDEKIDPADYQLQKLEHLIARLQRVYSRYSDRAIRPVEKLESIRNYSSSEIMDGHPDSDDQNRRQAKLDGQR